MAEGYVAWDLANLEEEVDDDFEELEEMEMERVLRRQLRDMIDPFSCPERSFRDYFRVSRERARDLCEWLRPLLERERRHGLCAEKQVLAALQFFASGSNQYVVGQDMNIAFSQPSVSRSIKAVAEAINATLLRRFVRFPDTAEERAAAKAKFAGAPQPFIGAIGAIDCTHVAIIGPREHEEGYVNHHGYHSMNVQAVCDPSFKILQVCARYPGARHDAFIWNASPLRQNMMDHYARGERQTWLIGDSGYPSEPWLLTPIPDADPDTPEFRYTQAHCKARSVIERCFGLLKGVWYCLSKKRVLLYDPASAGRIINACCVLHNLRLEYNMDPNDEDFEEDEVQREAGRAQERDIPEGQNRLAEGRRVRDAFIHRHFA